MAPRPLAVVADTPPTDVQVRRALGSARAAWDALLDPSRGRTMEWKRYGKKHPWSLRVNEGKRTVLWLVPEKGALRVAVILGEKAVARGLSEPLSQKLKHELREAEVYPEGRAVRYRMKSAARVRDVERLVDLKVGRTRCARSPPGTPHPATDRERPTTSTGPCRRRSRRRRRCERRP
jgi:hypothetical protein